jgi:hypothetical protein
MGEWPDGWLRGVGDPGGLNAKGELGRLLLAPRYQYLETVRRGASRGQGAEARCSLGEKEIKSALVASDSLH